MITFKICSNENAKVRQECRSLGFQIAATGLLGVILLGPTTVLDFIVSQDGFKNSIANSIAKRSPSLCERIDPPWPPGCV